ncbi:hypothetical protein RJ640_023650 [Escallonia rubra]|uniref:GAG-pre-integrase domain-containing protein n=1 Tax=Escallonia rubra TaxID=112253 RepID=A0AA88RD97_9ASTE|nr:hypothetical protein RJ640_023650 [Escallonia rubra]
MANAGVAEDNSDGADVLSVTISSSDGGWILDTGFSYHMCPNRDWFATYRSFDGGKVFMGNDVACKMVGIGSIQIMMHDGIVRTLTDVRHVPDLRKILISLGTLDSNGYSYRATGRVMRIMKGSLVVMKGLKQNSIYLLQGSTVTGAAATTLSSDIDSNTTKLWHMRLGHMSEMDIYVLSKQDLLGSKKIGKLDFCEHCVFGKQCRENEEPQEQQYNIARNIPRREIRPPQKYGYADMGAYALSVAKSIETLYDTMNLYQQRLLLNTEPASSLPSPPPPSHAAKTRGSYTSEANLYTNMVIILAALLCALICALGLNSIVCCADGDAFGCGGAEEERVTSDSGGDLRVVGA